MNTQQRRFVAIAIFIFVVAIFSRAAVFSIPGWKSVYNGLPEIMRWLEQPFRWMLLCLAGLFWAHHLRGAGALRELGLLARPAPALFFAFIACSPMLIGPVIFGKINSEISIPYLVFMAGVWPLAEEILFRGYAFRQLHRRAGFNFWIAAPLTGAVFGIAHLGVASVQKLPLSGEIGTVLIISIGGIAYAWLFVRWKDNLWVPFGMHCFMNLWWHLFDLADSPLGGWYPNLLRFLTVTLAIVLTLKRHHLRIFSDRHKS